MTPEQAKEMLPIITAWAERKSIQIWKTGKWRDVNYADLPLCYASVDYRIKPEPNMAKAFLRKSGQLDIDVEAHWVWVQNHPNFWKWVSEPFEITDQSC